jgi:chaperone BCS1
MPTIHLDPFDHKEFLRFLATHPPEGGWQTTGADAFTLDVDNAGIGTLTPLYGAFDYHHDGQAFHIEQHEEGEPQKDIIGLAYFRRLTVSHEDGETLRAFVTKAMSHRNKSTEGRIDVFFCRSKGYWERFGDICAQSRDHLFLPTAIKDDVFQRIDAFQANKERYVRYGRTHKIVFMFTGVPGSGKSSLVKSVARHYNASLHVLNFSKNMTDEALIEIMGGIPNDSVLLIEDVDAYFVDRKPQDGINVGFSALLNTLDGSLVKGNGLIVFMSSNHPENLDPALLRPGRVDKLYDFAWPRRSEIKTAFEELTEGGDGFDAFYAALRDSTSTGAAVRVNMSGVIDYLFRHPTDYTQHMGELLGQAEAVAKLTAGAQDKLYM